MYFFVYLNDAKAIFHISFSAKETWSKENSHLMKVLWQKLRSSLAPSGYILSGQNQRFWKPINFTLRS